MTSAAPVLAKEIDHEAEIPVTTTREFTNVEFDDLGKE